MQIKNLPLAEIKPYWRNPRSNDAAVAAVRSSIEQYGMNQPLVLDKSLTIIAGHTRYRALVEIGAKEAPCVVVALSAQKAKAYRIADNKSAELAQWDMEKLVQELREIEDIADMQVFFPTDDLDAMLKETAGAVDFATPSQAQIDAQAASNAEKFNQVNAKAAADQIEVTCPHCLNNLYVSRDDLNRRMDAGMTT